MTHSPISRVGGKFRLAPKIVSLFPPHSRYIEAFGGAMHVMFRKEPAPFEVYNDIDENLVTFFRVVKNCPEELIRELDLSLYARMAFEEAVSTLDIGTDVERAAKFYLVNRQCFGGKMKEWAITTYGNNGFYKYDQRIREAHERIKNAYIECRDFRWIIQRFDHDEAFFYLDPPYIYNEFRGPDKLYKHEMTDSDHAELVELLKGIKGKFILSGYENELYDYFDRVFIGESPMDIKGVPEGEKRPKKSEYVWKNY